MRLILVAIIMSVVPIAVAVAITQGEPSAVPQTGAAAIVVDDARFTPNRLDATVGQPLTVSVTNLGTLQHDLTFESVHMPGLGGAESIVRPGQTAVLTLAFDEPGYHTFVCAIPGHAGSAMIGAVFVSPAGRAQ